MNRRALFSLSLKIILVYVFINNIGFWASNFGIPWSMDKSVLIFSAMFTIFMPFIILLCAYKSDAISLLFYRKLKINQTDNMQAKKVFLLVLKVIGSLCFVYGLPELFDVIAKKISNIDKVALLLRPILLVLYMCLGYYFIKDGKAISDFFYHKKNK